MVGAKMISGTTLCVSATLGFVLARLASCVVALWATVTFTQQDFMFWCAAIAGGFSAFLIPAYMKFREARLKAVLAENEATKDSAAAVLKVEKELTRRQRERISTLEKEVREWRRLYQAITERPEAEESSDEHAT